MTRTLAAALLLAVLAGSCATPRNAPSAAQSGAPLKSPEVASRVVADSGDVRPSGAPTPSRNVLEAASATAQPAGRVAPSPAPTSGIGTALWTASATWCAPTPKQCRKWGSDALLAALPTYTGTPWRVRVWYGKRHVDVTVVSICGCGIDLSPYAFRQLAPLDRGRIPVEVEGPITVDLPPTDGAP